MILLLLLLLLFKPPHFLSCSRARADGVQTIAKRWSEWVCVLVWRFKKRREERFEMKMCVSGNKEREGGLILLFSRDPSLLLLCEKMWSIDRSIEFENTKNISKRAKDENTIYSLTRDCVEPEKNCANLQQKQNPLRTNKTSERKRRRRRARKNTHSDREREREREKSSSSTDYRFDLI